MGCCGKIKDIAIANIGFSIEKVFGLPAFKYEFANERHKTCLGCEKQTWLTKAEWWAWAKEQGLIKVAKNLDDLTEFPMLPKQGRGKGKHLCCMICKCFIPKKIRLKKETCPLNKWER